MRTVKQRVSRLEDHFAPAAGQQIVMALYDAGHKLPLDGRNPYSDPSRRRAHRSSERHLSLGLYSHPWRPECRGAGEVPPRARHAPQMRVNPLREPTAILQRVLTRVPGDGKFRVSGDLHGTLVKSLMC